MHASLAVAFAYDRHLNGPSGGRRTLEECYHWSLSTTLFNRRLREPIETKDMDTIWGTVAALAILTFSFPDAHTPEGSWPLKPSSPLDLEWLRMSKGKMSLWRITNPLRPDRLFRVMAGTFAQMNSPLPKEGLDGVPMALAIVCHLEHSSTAENNPYFNAAHAVSQIQDLPDNQVTVGQTELFTRSIYGPFESLLREKDPVTLLLLYGIAKQAAVYGGLNLGLEWNVLLFARTYVYTTTGTVLYRHFFREALLPIVGAI